MDTRDAGRMGAFITNKKLTTEGRSKAAKKGWRTRKQKVLDHKKDGARYALVAKKA